MKHLGFIITFLLCLAAFTQLNSSTLSVTQWHTQIEKHRGNPKKAPLLTAAEVINTLSGALHVRLQQLRSLPWLGTSDFIHHFFVEKRIIVPSQQIISFGDLHGDALTLTHALQQLLKQGLLHDNWQLTPNVMLLFLGDYVDRGNYGAEVLYTICKLLLTNPTQVLCVRGNHEDVSLNTRYGFYQELIGKYDTSVAHQLIQQCGAWYKVLPVALYVGCVDIHKITNYTLCCHGCIEIGFNPQQLLTSNYNQIGQCLTHLAAGTILDQLQGSTAFIDGFNNKLGMSERTRRDCIDIEAPLQPIDIGFMWNDCTALGDQQITKLMPGRKISLGSKLTKLLINYGNTSTHQVRSIVRGHQHNDSMPQLLLPQHKGRFRLQWHYPIDTVISTQKYTPVPAMLAIQPSTAGWPAWHFTTLPCISGV